jgi:KDO2-lipid IV(A) lauroyltransferase
MDTLLYIIASGLIRCLQALPLEWVVRLGRWGGLMAYALDARHRRVARQNLSRHFPEKSQQEVQALVKENFARIGESFVSSIKTASMTDEEMQPHLDFRFPTHWKTSSANGPPPSIVVAIGHFGNFELYPRLVRSFPEYQGASTYRALPQPSLNRLMQDLRERSGCVFFERRSEGGKLRVAMQQQSVMLGLFCDQDGGDRGLQLPFLGHNCSTSHAAALYALRYECLLYSAICYRVGLGQWQVECGPEIPTHDHGQARSPADIMRDVNQALEAGVRRDPANWFWVHNRWKRGRPDPPAQTGEAQENHE